MFALSVDHGVCVSCPSFTSACAGQVCFSTAKSQDWGRIAKGPERGGKRRRSILWDWGVPVQRYHRTHGQTGSSQTSLPSEPTLSHPTCKSEKPLTLTPSPKHHFFAHIKGQWNNRSETKSLLTGEICLLWENNWHCRNGKVFLLGGDSIFPYSRSK